MNVVLDASEAQATTFLQHLYCLPITTDKTEPLIQGREAFLRGRSTGLTAYDADYINLALRQGGSSGRKIMRTNYEQNLHALE